jgi:anti-sigma regulatory factor (Ser/Thr protein kinase)
VISGGIRLGANLRAGSDAMFKREKTGVYAGSTSLWEVPMSCDLILELPRSPEAASLARKALEDLNGCLDPARLPDVRLLVSELVTNSVKYGGDGPVRLEVSRDENRIRAEIIDQGAGFTPKVRNDDLDKVGGWGLHLTEHLTDRWGTHEGSTHVWFEMDLKAA